MSQLIGELASRGPRAAFEHARKRKLRQREFRTNGLGQFVDEAHRQRAPFDDERVFRAP